jgi:hypothetical protein
MARLTLVSFFSILLLPFLLSASDALAITFNDGGVHVIDAENSFPFETMTWVRDGPGPTSTTLILVDGGCLGCDSDVNGDLSFEGMSVGSMSGGTVGDDVITGGTATLNLSGGTFGGQLYANDSSAITILGFGFNFPLGDIDATAGTLTGFLADGAPLNAEFGRISTATITLIPEPRALHRPAPRLRARGDGGGWQAKGAVGGTGRGPRVPVRCAWGQGDRRLAVPDGTGDAGVLPGVREGWGADDRGRLT